VVSAASGCNEHSGRATTLRGLVQLPAGVVDVEESGNEGDATLVADGSPQFGYLFQELEHQALQIGV